VPPSVSSFGFFLPLDNGIQLSLVFGYVSISTKDAPILTFAEDNIMNETIPCIGLGEIGAKLRRSRRVLPLWIREYGFPAFKVQGKGPWNCYRWIWGELRERTEGQETGFFSE
jgi:hypothetical protein